MKLSRLTIIICALLAGAYVWLFTRQELNAEAWGQLTGRLLAAIIFGYGAAKLSYRKSKSNKSASTAFLGIFFIVVVASLNQVKLKPHEFTNDEKVVVRQFMDSVQKQSTAISQEFDSEFERAGAALLLDPQRLDKDKSKNFKESAETISKMRAAVDNLEKKYPEYYAQIEKQIMELPIPENQRQDMLKGFKSRRARAEQVKLLPSIQLHRKIIDNSEKIVTLLKENEDGFELDGGTLAFYEDGTLKSYNEYITSVQSDSEKLEKLFTQAQEEQKTALDEFSKLTEKK